jgi:uncharacterized protein YfbU (UPF0304 family)
VEKGYTLRYEWLTEHLYDEMAECECREVLDILEMYRAMIFSQQKLGESEELTEKSVRFPGFDSNNEAKQHSYTRYLVIDVCRNGTQYPDFNSHCKMLPTYKSMLNIWNSLSDKYDLAANEIKKILEIKSSLLK